MSDFMFAAEIRLQGPASDITQRGGAERKRPLHTEGTMLLFGDRPCSDGGAGAVHVFHGEIVVLVPEWQSSGGGGVHITLRKGDMNPC